MSSLTNLFKHPKHRRLWEWVVLVLLVAVLAVTLYFCVQNFEYYRLRGYIRPMHNRRQVIASPDDIQSWMTLRYINVVFRLPPDYLKNSLQITDKHYPNISITALARQQHQSVAAELSKLIAAVKNPK